MNSCKKNSKSYCHIFRWLFKLFGKLLKRCKEKNKQENHSDEFRKLNNTTISRIEEHLNTSKDVFQQKKGQIERMSNDLRGMSWSTNMTFNPSYRCKDNFYWKRFSTINCLLLIFYILGSPILRSKLWVI